MVTLFGRRGRRRIAVKKSNAIESRPPKILQMRLALDFPVSNTNRHSVADQSSQERCSELIEKDVHSHVYMFYALRTVLAFRNESI